MATPSRYVLLRDLDAAIKHLDDQQLDKLVSAALQERTRRRGPLAPDKKTAECRGRFFFFAARKIERRSSSF
jgi:hypothetical protein